ncbi:MAG TPA: TatD family hydrolase [Bacteroidaceae bacterium]|nr:TatD family hydrolase [Bacteroidaceae bacterium]
MIIDIHSHKIPTIKGSALINLSLYKPEIIEGHYYSAGIHPWSVNGDMSFELDRLKEILLLPQVLALGEVGLDSLKSSNKEWQERVLLAQIEMSEYLHKPIIFHIVKEIDTIIKLKKSLSPKSSWLIHGFRGNDIERVRLRKLGFNLSFGMRYNQSALLKTPLSELFLESDSDGDILKLLDRVSLLKEIPQSTIMREVANNIRGFLGTNIVE